MNNIKRCCFAGHSNIYDSNVTKRIKKVAEDLILNSNVKEFWVGHYGNFDGFSAAAVRELKKTYSDIELDLVIPYLTKDINEYKKRYYKDFNNIIMAEIPENIPKRFHIIKANEYMVNYSSYMICYIQWTWGGAFTTYKYAKKKELKIFNVAEIPINQ